MELSEFFLRQVWHLTDFIYSLKWCFLKEIIIVFRNMIDITRRPTQLKSLPSQASHDPKFTYLTPSLLWLSYLAVLVSYIWPALQAVQASWRVNSRHISDNSANNDIRKVKFGSIDSRQNGEHNGARFLVISHTLGVQDDLSSELYHLTEVISLYDHISGTRWLLVEYGVVGTPSHLGYIATTK